MNEIIIVITCENMDRCTVDRDITFCALFSNLSQTNFNNLFCKMFKSTRCLSQHSVNNQIRNKSTITIKKTKNKQHTHLHVQRLDVKLYHGALTRALLDFFTRASDNNLHKRYID